MEVMFVENTILEMKKIEKQFVGVYALKGVDFSVKQGEVHSLMGENGAGKSTLIKVLTGVYLKSNGNMIFDGNNINPKSTLEAQEIGISTIYQELNLVLQQKIYENIFLGREYVNKFGKLDKEKMISESKIILEDMGIDVDATMELGACSTAIQQMVAIARAISTNAKLVIMDEPTSSLSTNEVKVLFSVIEKLKANNIAVIFISHHLDEIFEIADRVTILKDGELVGTYNIEDIDKYQMVALMVGKGQNTVIEAVNHKDICQGETILELKDCNDGIKLQGVDLTVKKGEVVGIGGLLGSGRTEVAKVIFGAQKMKKGVLYLNGKEMQRYTIPKAIDNGLGYCTEDRKVEGIIPHLSVADNLTIALSKDISKFGVINTRKQAKIVNEYIEKIHIKTPSMNQEIRNLSGGNQQKVLLARWMAMRPELIVMDEPTRGIDVGAKAEIEEIIQGLAAEGISVIMISSELDELVRNCNRVVVLRDGKKTGELETSSITHELIMKFMAGESEEGLGV